MTERRGEVRDTIPMRIRHALTAAALVALAVWSGVPGGAQSARSPFDALHFRDIGPAVTSGRIHDIQIDPKNPSVLYVGTAAGGIWKSTSKGLMWKDVFAGQPDNTFGALAIFEKDPQVVWAGTGEQNNRQSSSWGGGVYRSTNGGDTWTYLGLHETRSIGRVVLDPADPNVAYIAAVGNLWAANPERGVFKTIDAGKTWSKVLFVDDVTGATDLVMDPRNSSVLYAATYQRMRSACCFDGGGPGSAIYKTTDAGAHWMKLENGIPAGDKGRIGLAIAASKPDVLVATIEHATATGTYRSEDAGATWKQMSRTNPRPMYYSKPTIDPNNDKHIWLPGVSIVHSLDGGVTFVEEPTSADLRPRSQDGPPRVARRSRQLESPLRGRRRRPARELRHGQDLRPSWRDSGRAGVPRSGRQPRSLLGLCGLAGQPLVDGPERDAPLARHSQ